MTIFDGGADPLAALAALRSQLSGANGAGTDDAGMAMLMQLMQQTKAASSAAAPSAPDDIPDPGPVAPAEPPGTFDAAARADVQALVDRSVEMDAELVALRQRNDALAAALGACHLCYGEDDWCRHCGGRGHPGSRRPDGDAFDRYVRPVLARLARSRASPAPMPHRHAASSDGMSATLPGTPGSRGRPPADAGDA